MNLIGYSQEMRLYHFTSRQHLPLILESGFLKTVESNIGAPIGFTGKVGEHVGPDVVWLTSVPRILKNTNGLGYFKTAVRFVVEIPDAIHWKTFAEQHGINRRWYQILDKTGGYNARNWWVCPRPILKTEWIEYKITEWIEYTTFVNYEHKTVSK